MPDHEVDLFVIGGGSGGVRAARIAAEYGARVMVAEEYRLGGTCVIRGCVPKKLLVYASRFHGEFEDAAGFGWTVPHASFDWPTLIANKDKEIARLEAVAAGHRADFERERERADRLMVELLQATAETMAAKEATARLEGILRTSGRAGGLIDSHGQAARRPGQLAAQLVAADRKTSG